MKRFAGSVDYEVGSNDEIEQIVDHFKKLVIEAIPTSDEDRYKLTIMFEAVTGP